MNNMYDKIVMKYKKSVTILLVIGIIVTLASLMDKVELAYSSYKAGYYTEKVK